MTAARRLAAYAAGYSRLKGADEAGTASVWLPGVTSMALT